VVFLVPPPLAKVAHGTKRKAQGVLFLLFVAFMIWLSAAFYNKTFITVTPVTLKTSHTGTQLSEGADVKLRGIIVGDVRGVNTTGNGATIKLALQPAKAKLIPQNVVARILPKTLFGQKFVDLVIPDQTSPNETSLHSGSVINEDHSRNAIEVEKVLDNILPVIDAVQPQQLNTTLTNLADALEGRGDELGQNLVNLDDYLRQFNKHLPSFTADISELASVADIYSKAAPDLLRFLENSAFSSRTVTAKQETLRQFLRDTAAFADTATGFLTTNQTRLIQLGQVSAPILGELASRSSQISLTIDGLAQIAPKLETVFGTGSNKNWLHISLIPISPKGAYSAPNDCPKYINKEGAQYGPNCGVASAATSADTNAATVLSKLGPAPAPNTGTSADVVGSPAEQKLIAQIVGAVTKSQSSSNLTDDSVADLLLGPMLRGTTVTAP
jgi:phospholipid/cholesterol/gamma-HCH transport system substrate-binding protein